jgi:hypothetical protein
VGGGECVLGFGGCWVEACALDAAGGGVLGGGLVVQGCKGVKAEAGLAHPARADTMICYCCVTLSSLLPGPCLAFIHSLTPAGEEGFLQVPQRHHGALGWARPRGFH